MAQRAVLWSSVLLVGALLAASAPWSRVLPPCGEVAAAQRERDRLAGRCEGSAPIVNVPASARGVVASARRAVPDLRGRLFNQRDERLARYIVAIDYRESAQRRDWVIDQVPRPPATLPDGGNLRVVLSDGGLVRVPDVRGGFARALVLLYRAGLSWTAGDGPSGPVLGQVPAPGTAVKPGTQIVLRLSPAPVALAPESTRPTVAPSPPPTVPPATVPGAPPAGATTPPAATTPAPPAASPPAQQAAPATTVMPDLQGMIFDAARQRLAGYSVQRVHRAGTEPGGTVIGQSPTAGAPLAPGTSVRLVLSDGTLVRVPRVTSFTLTEARQRLSAGELRPAITNVASDAPAGTVVSQQPSEGQIAQRGSSIRVTVSSGPTDRPAAAPAAAATVTVPNLVGSSFDRARSQLERFKVERSERAAREPVGTILEQSPAPGTKVDAGSPLSIIVSSGGRPETIEVANVVGQGADAATSALSEFRLERVAVPSIEPAGRVLSQDPPAGATVAPGSTVRLRVSDGSRVSAPSLAHMTLAQARDTARAAGLTLALGGGSDDAAALVQRQDPAPGTEIARGSTLQVVVEDRSLPFNVPPAVRDAWSRASLFVTQQSARNLAIAAVVLLALLALLLLSRRRPRAPYAPTEPVFGPTRAMPNETLTRPLPRAPAPVPPAPVPSAEPPTAVEPPVARPAAAPPIAATPIAATPPAAPSPAPPSTRPAPPKPKVRKAMPPPAAVPRREPEPVVLGATARLESDPASTVAPTAARHGPEIRIAARLEAGAASVRELPAQTAPDELTEETK